MLIAISNCARCTGTHDEIEFKKLTNPVFEDDFNPMGDRNLITYTHWAICPTSHQPILLRIVDL